jgi:hypothetical protein
MRNTIMLAAIVAALGSASQPAEADDRGFGSFVFRHFSGHASPRLQLRHNGLDFHHGGFFGKPLPFKPRPFGHFDHRDFVFRFGYVPHSEPRHFGRFDRGGPVLKFGNGDFMLKFGHMLHFKPEHFGDRHQGGGLHRGAPSEALLRQLEQMGFRYVPELLRNRDR